MHNSDRKVAHGGGTYFAFLHSAVMMNALVPTTAEAKRRMRFYKNGVVVVIHFGSVVVVVAS